MFSRSYLSTLSVMKESSDILSSYEIKLICVV